MRGWLIATTHLLLACGGTSPEAIAPGPSEPARRAAQPDAAVDAPPPTTTIDAAVEAPRAASIPDACSGADLDLRALFDADTCTSNVAAAPFPAGLTVTIDPPLRAKRGTPAHGAIVIANPTDAAIDLHLDARCGVDDQIETAIFDARGARADLITPCGPGGGGCGGGTMSLRIAPHGRARFPVTVATQQRRQDATCTQVSVKPLAAGTYTVDVHAMFLPTPLKAPLVVTR